MATETLFPNGTYSGTGWTGTGSNITEGITAANGDEISSASDGEGDVVTIDIASSALADSDTITNVSIQVRARCTDDGGDESITVNLIVDSSAQTAVTGTPGEMATTHTTFAARNDATWNTDWTAAQLDALQVTVVGVQSGMPTPNYWHIDTLEVVITYTPGASPISKSPDLKALALDDTLTPLAGIDWVTSPDIKALVLTELLAVDFQGRGLRLTGLEPTKVVSDIGTGINILRLRREGYA